MSKIMGVLKGIGSFVSGVKKIATVADRINDDLDGDGKMELENLKEDFVAIEKFVVAKAKYYGEKLKVLFGEMKHDFEDLSVQAKHSMQRVEKLLDHIKE